MGRGREGTPGCRCPGPRRAPVPRGRLGAGGRRRLAAAGLGAGPPRSPLPIGPARKCKELNLQPLPERCRGSEVAAARSESALPAQTALVWGLLTGIRAASARRTRHQDARPEGRQGRGLQESCVWW